MMSDKPRLVLTVQDLSVNYDAQRILQNLSFTVEEASVFVILGPNGAGKTSLLRALLDLVPYQGRVTWQTRNISYLPPHELVGRRDIPPLTIEEFFRLKTPDRAATERVITAVGLDESFLRRPFGALSTGQFQRMLIGWALVNDPDVLLLDEPTSGIDVGGEETIYTLLSQFRQRKPLTILLVTHDLHAVWAYATRVLCLNRQILCMGAPQEVLTPQQLQSLYGTGLKFYAHSHR